MSAILIGREPYRLSAGMLALAVHMLFFFLLYAGFRWQAQPPGEFVVERWDSLPQPVPQSPQPAVLQPEPKLPQPEPKAAPEAISTPQVRAEIEVRDRKARQNRKLAEEKARAAAREKERRELEAYSERLRQAEQARLVEQARIRAEIDADIAAQVDRYQDMIRAKVRRNIVMPPDVPESATVEFKVTLLPGGNVLDVVLLQSSGHAAYDAAAERAIYKAQPLPVPTDAGLQKMFRELKLTVRP